MGALQDLVHVKSAVAVQVGDEDGDGGSDDLTGNADGHVHNRVLSGGGSGFFGRSGLLSGSGLFSGGSAFGNRAREFGYGRIRGNGTEVAGHIFIKDRKEVAVVQRQGVFAPGTAVDTVGDADHLTGLYFRRFCTLIGQGHVLVKAEGAAVVEPQPVVGAGHSEHGRHVEQRHHGIQAGGRHGHGFTLDRTGGGDGHLICGTGAEGEQRDQQHERQDQRKRFFHKKYLLKSIHLRVHI